jgi:hypothetical protein
VQLLKDVAKYVRSKNAGPFWVTIDIFCGDDASFDLLRNAKSLGALAIADLYKLNSNEVRIFHDRALKVIKISFPRPVAQGSARDTDSHAGQYFVPMLDLVVT